MVRSSPTNLSPGQGIPATGYGDGTIRVTRGVQPATIAARLPAEARAAFMAIADAAADAQSLNAGASEVSSEAATRASRARRELDDLERDNRLSMSPSPSFNVEAERLRAVMRAAQDEWSRCTARSEEANAKWQGLSRLYGRLTGWLESIPRDRKIVAHRGPQPQLRKGETVATAIEIPQVPNSRAEGKRPHGSQRADP